MIRSKAYNPLNPPSKEGGGSYLKVAISACLLGKKVRYDGLSKRHDSILKYLADKVEFIPFCPEMGIGLTVPREKIHLYKLSDLDLGNSNGQVRVKEIDNHSMDYTDKLTNYARSFIVKNSDISAMILKSKSPSCGLLSTPIAHYEQSKELAELDYYNGSGQFSHTIATEYPVIKLIEETELDSENKCKKFLSDLSLSND